MKYDALNAFKEIQWLANGETVQAIALSWSTMNLVSMNLASLPDNIPALPKRKRIRHYLWRKLVNIWITTSSHMRPGIIHLSLGQKTGS